YARYMDDFIILAQRRWPLRKAVRDLNRFFNLSGFEQHPDKTYIGRVEHGFDWLGVQLCERGVTGISPRSWE
ncbi:transposase, partial [Aeromonas veronii]|uniref:reverse transcriptase domain-containing protein n=1 Tax=Aeromonas veronii TaxID=654 RepID=UPI00237247F9|nr:transposase [Aeromonas veronii]